MIFLSFNLKNFRSLSRKYELRNEILQNENSKKPNVESNRLESKVDKKIKDFNDDDFFIQ